MSIYRRVANLFSRGKVQREIESEMASHVEMRVADNMAAGMTEREARRDARMRFGNPQVMRERTMASDSVLLLESVWVDIRYACRGLWMNPGFAGTAIGVLALGIGASVALFAFVDAALIKPLPYADPARLVGVFETTPECPRCNVSYLNFRDWKKSQRPFQALEVWGFNSPILLSANGREPVMATRVSDGFFRALGVRPMLGRDFYPGEDAPGAARTAVISYGAWQNRFGNDAHVLGKTVTLDELPYTVVGVLPAEFQFAPRGDAEFWVTLNEPNGCEKRRACHNLFGLGRLQEGVSPASAAASMLTMQQQLEKQYPDSNKGMGGTAIALTEVIVGDIRPILLALLAGASLLLLIACVNVSSLLLVRAESRRREMALRGALGASAMRLVRQYVTEGLVLGLAGSGLGIAAADGTIRLMLKLIPADRMASMPYLQRLGLNPQVLLFAGAVSALAVGIFSIVPALRMNFTDMRGDHAERSRGTGGRGWRRLGSRLVAVELAMAVVLLVCAGLLGKSLYRLLHVELGLQPDHLATLLVDTPKALGEDAQEMAMERQIVTRIQSLPGVRSVGITSHIPVRDWDGTARIRIVERTWHGERNEVPERDISPGYFKTLGARMVRGREFTDAENEPSKPHVAIVNQAFAKQYFPGEDAIGKQIAYALSSTSIEIVGIVEDIQEGKLDTVSRATMYMPFNQNMWNSFEVIVRTNGGDARADGALLPELTAAIHGVDTRITVRDVQTMDTVIQNSQPAYLHRTAAWLVGGFAGMALVLAVVGLYGVIAYSVGQRTREIGVRMALGAQRSSVYGMVMREAGWLTAVGIGAGLLCSVAMAALMRSLLFGTQAWDGATLAAVAALLAVFAMLASYIPARRAASVNPVDALRAE